MSTHEKHIHHPTQTKTYTWIAAATVVRLRAIESNSPASLGLWQGLHSYACSRCSTHTQTRNRRRICCSSVQCAQIMRDAIFRSALCVHIAAIVVPFAVCVCVWSILFRRQMHSHARSGRFVYYLIVHSPERNNVCNSYNILAHTQHTLSVVSFILCCRE